LINFHTLIYGICRILENNKNEKGVELFLGSDKILQCVHSSSELKVQVGPRLQHPYWWILLHWVDHSVGQCVLQRVAGSTQ